MGKYNFAHLCGLWSLSDNGNNDDMPIIWYHLIVCGIASSEYPFPILPGECDIFITIN